jgi:hypothetical protein
VLELGAFLATSLCLVSSTRLLALGVPEELGSSLSFAGEGGGGV